MIPVILLVVALVVAVVAGLAWSAKLPGNGYIGIRAPEARKSRENWDITHRVAGPPWAVSALAFVGSAALAFVAIQPGASGWMWLWVVVAGLLGLVMLGVGGAIGAHTIALYDAKKTAESESAGCGSDCGCGSAEAEACETNPANGAGDACCSSGAGTAAANAATPNASAAATPNTSAPRDPSSDCGVAGGCGSCGLNGMCEDGNATFGSAANTTRNATGNTAGNTAPNASAAVDRDALRRAARATDAE